MQNWLRMKSSSCIKINYLNCFERLLSVAFKDVIPKPTHGSCYFSLTFSPDFLPCSFQHDAFDQGLLRFCYNPERWTGPREHKELPRKPRVRRNSQRQEAPARARSPWVQRGPFWGATHSVYMSIFSLPVSVPINTLHNFSAPSPATRSRAGHHCTPRHQHWEETLTPQKRVSRDERVTPEL